MASTLSFQPPSSVSAMCYLCDLLFSHTFHTPCGRRWLPPNCCECSSLADFIHTDLLLDHPSLQELKFALEASDGVVRLSNVCSN